MQDTNYNPETLPEVHDEAAPTPRWVPILGVVLVCVGLVAVAICASHSRNRLETPNIGSHADGN